VPESCLLDHIGLISLMPGDRVRLKWWRKILNGCTWPDPFFFFPPTGENDFLASRLRRKVKNRFSCTVQSCKRTTAYTTENFA
jgi:hypothetical protein